MAILRKKKERGIVDVIHYYGGKLCKDWYDFNNVFKKLGRSPTEPHWTIGLFRNTTENITGEYLEYMEYYVFYNYGKFDECRQTLNTMTKDFVCLEAYILENHDF